MGDELQNYYEWAALLQTEFRKMQVEVRSVKHRLEVLEAREKGDPMISEYDAQRVPANNEVHPTPMLSESSEPSASEPTVCAPVDALGLEERLARLKAS